MITTFYYCYDTNKFMTGKEVTQKEEKLFLAEYEIGPRSGRPMYKGDYEYDPNEGFTIYQRKRVK